MIEEYLKIGKAITKVMHISREQIESTSKKSVICDARNMLASILKKEFSSASLVDIAEIMGKKNHTTILNMYKNHSNRLQNDECYKLHYDMVLDILYHDRTKRYDIINMYAVYRPNGSIIIETIQRTKEYSWNNTFGTYEQGFRCEQVEVRITKL